jgi:methionine aminopeptidase
LTKYKTAAQISEKVLAAVSKLCVPGAKIVEICEKGDALLEEELGKVYRGKKINKGTFATMGLPESNHPSTSPPPHVDAP